MHLVLIGAPGSGKGTQATRLVDRFGIDHISTGDMLRATAAEDSSMGRMVKEIMDQGNLIADQMVSQLVDYRLQHDHLANGFVMDGYPRTEVQIVTFDRSLARQGLRLTAAILLDVDDDIVVERMAGRRIDPENGQIYNIYDSDDLPVSLSERLVQRDDDTEAIMRERLATYHKQIDPVIAHYEHTHQLWRIDGLRSPNVVFEDLFHRLKIHKTSD